MMVSDNCMCSKCCWKYQCKVYAKIVKGQQMMRLINQLIGLQHPEYDVVVEFQTRSCNMRKTYEEKIYEEREREKKSTGRTS
jgi:hypothetical protein